MSRRASPLPESAALTQTTISTTAAQRLVQMLEQLGVGLVFGLPGVHNLSIYKALRDSPIRLVGVRHEQTAVYAADGYARATGRLGVAVVTTGPGAANTVGATGEAMASGSPVLVIATDIPSRLRRPGVYRGVLHETRDQTAMFVPVTKSARVVQSASEVSEAVLECAAIAQRAQSGPVYLGIPTDLLSQDVGGASPAAVPSSASGAVAASSASGAAASSPGSEAPRQPYPGPSDADVDRACAALAGARRPLIWAGGGALRSGAGALIGELALALAAPVITTYMGRGLIAPEHPCAVPGPVQAAPVGALWDEADVVLAVGSDLDGMMTQNWLMPTPPTLLAVNVDEADASKNYPADLTLVGDAGDVLTRLVARIAPRDGLGELERRLEAIGGRVAASISDDDEDATRLLDVTERALPADTVVVVDMCVAGYWIAGYRRVPAPRKLAYPMGWGTLGFGFPASLGACLADAGPTVCITGDGGFLFACGELATVAQERLPLTIVLVDDGGYGMLRFDQIQAGDEPFGVDLATPDFAALAAAFGIPATTLDGFGPEFEAALADSIVGGEPRLIVVRAALTPPPTTSPRWYRRA